MMALPCDRCVLSGTERQVKGEYLMMKNHGLRRIFSLLLVVIMVCALLPTAALAEETTETKPVVAEVPQSEEPEQEEAKTFTVTYTDGVNGTVFKDDVHSNLNANTATPAFTGETPTREGYTFKGWVPTVAEAVTENATYTATWDEDANVNGEPPAVPSVAWIGETGYPTLEAAVNVAVSGDTIVLGEGKFTLYHKGASTKGKSLTFVGQGADKTAWGIGAEVPDPAHFGTEYNGDYSFDGSGTITFRNMTLQSGSADYLGFIRADNTVVENCTINGKTFYWGYSSAIFRNTTFVCPRGD